MNESVSYDFLSLEKKWQKKWEQNQTFSTHDFSDKPKYYILDMFPYPSGNGLHVGHVEGYTATDIIARYKRMQGFNVLHPMGWDAFGLPAEQYAIKTSTKPQVTTAKNIATFKQQIKRIGKSIDWNKEINTTDPNYYKWTQWIFLQLFKKGLAYQSYKPVNWCPALGTVLADEEVIDGKSEVGDFPVEKKPIRQWVLKITDYAERLLDDLEGLDWPESTKEMQKNWIGKSVGAEVVFKIKGHSDKQFTIFTTRPDTLFGASFCTLAPEHPLVKQITTNDFLDQVDEYTTEASNKTDMNRLDTSLEKTGVATGAFAINPVNNDEIPIYISDYVLMTYGTGAIMAVPAHDERDHAFAKKFRLPIKEVVSSTQDINEGAFTGDGKLINSDFLNGLSKENAISAMCRWLIQHKHGQKKTIYRLRDWVFSRQRYWGEPFPLIHDKEGHPIAVEEHDLPVVLPEVDDFKPSGSNEPPLAKQQNWVNVVIGKTKYTRETNIMPQWAGSCWYYLRYLDPHNNSQAWDPKKEKYWLPVDLYVGGVEHANLHLLYARFWHKVLYDLKLVSTKEPFKKVLHQGLVLGPNGEKMSKSRGNVINPDDVIKEWGTDSLRTFEMFLGPIDQAKPWQTKGISGVHRFLKRFWAIVINKDGTLSPQITKGDEGVEVKKQCHKTIKKVTEDTENFHFNTAIASMMEFLNFLYKQKTIAKITVETFTKLLSPYAPHLCEEIWERLGYNHSIAYEEWPKFNPTLIIDQDMTLAVMINGKKRGTLTLPQDLDKVSVLKQAKAQEFVQRYLKENTIKKEIYVPGKIISFVL